MVAELKSSTKDL